MKATAFIRKTAKKNDLGTKATIYFRLRDGKKDIKAASELSISPNHWSPEKQGYKDRVALVPEDEKIDLNHKVQALSRNGSINSLKHSTLLAIECKKNSCFSSSVLYSCKFIFMRLA